MFPFPHPTDINWANISIKYDHRYFRFLLYNLIAIAVLLFLTSPAAFIAVVTADLSYNSIFPVQFVKDTNSTFRFVFTALLPATIILIANEILTYFLGFITELERKTRYSTHQVSKLRKTFIYLLFNVIIVPGFAAALFSNLYEVIKFGNQGFKNFVIRLFEVKLGDFFLVILLGGAGTSFISIFNYLSILLKNYMSPQITMQSRAYARQEEHWLRDNGSLWGYASNYGSTCVLSGLAIVFQ